MTDDTVMWTDKYRPIHLDDMVGFKKTIIEVKRYIISFKLFRKYQNQLKILYENPYSMDAYEKGKLEQLVEKYPRLLDFIEGKRGLLLIGKPGIGKTTVVRAAALDFNFHLNETNASESRGEENIQNLLKTSIGTQCIFNFIGSKRTKGMMFLFDEVDGLSTSGESSGAKCLADYIRQTKHPIILTANNNTKSIGSIAPSVKIVECDAPTRKTIASMLKRIAENEKLEVDDAVIEKIALQSEGDFRSAVNDLQFIVQSKIDFHDISDIDLTRDRKTDLEKALRSLFTSITLKEGRNAVGSMELGSRYIDYYYKISNLAYYFPSRDNMDNVVSLLVKIDQLLLRIDKDKDYSTLGMYFDMLSMFGIFQGIDTIDKEFPKWSMWKASSPYTNDAISAVLKKLQKIFPKSLREIYDEIIPILIVLFQKDDILREETFSDCEIIGAEWTKMIQVIDKGKKYRS